MVISSSNLTKLSALLLLVYFISSPAQAVLVEGMIETDIRPAVTIRYWGAAGNLAERTAVGILDTGDPQETLSRETASFLGLGLAGPLDQGATASQNITSGGWLGGVLDPPERNTIAADPDINVRAGDRAHIFANAGLARTHEVTSGGIHPYLYDYNDKFSENHTSTAFLSQANPADNLVTFVDPINGSPLPFAYDRTNGGNGRGLGGGASLPLDQRTSSVTYFANNDPRVPIPGRNDNPGFVYFFELTPVEFGSTTLTPARANTSVDAGLPEDRRLTLTVSNEHGPNVDRLVTDQFGGLDPGYRPVDAMGNLIAATYSMEVKKASLAIGGEQNPNGFERRDGSVRVLVRQQDGTMLLDQTVALPSQAPRPHGSIIIPELGINTGKPGLIDTGAPSAGDGVAVGTDTLNRFGQFFDFEDNRLTLIGPSDSRIRTLRGNGILFNVDNGTLGLAATAVEQEALFGSIPQLQGNPTSGTGAATVVGPIAPPEAASTTFRTHLTGSNASYIDEAAIGVARGVDVINSQALGADGISPGAKLFFGVDNTSQGQPGSAVSVQRGLNQHQSDIFEIPFNQASPFRIPQSNSLTINQEVMGLGPNVGPGATAPNSSDNLLGFDLLTQLALPQRSLSNLDSPIVEKNDDGTPARPRIGDDRLAVNFDTYFSVADSQDIFKSDLANVFADGFFDIGLSLTGLDDIDALALFRPSVGPGIIGPDDPLVGPILSPDLIINPANGGFTFDPNTTAGFLGIDAFVTGVPTDLALFSLTPDSPTLAVLGLSPADIFVTDFDGTFTLFGSAESLGLRFTDNVDGLDSIPEPSTPILLCLGLAGLVTLRRLQEEKSTVVTMTGRVV